MPTGYTAIIRDGITFEQFAMRCARAFGGLVDMREDSLNAEIPTVQRVAEYKLSSLREAMSAHDALLAISPRQYAARAREAHRIEMARWNDRATEAALLAQRYREMLVKIEAWEPPTAEHVGVKEFMRQQVEDSLKHDCSDFPMPKKLTGKQWFQKQMEAAEWNLEWSAQNYAEGVEAARKRTTWVAKLRESLA